MPIKIWLAMSTASIKGHPSCITHLHDRRDDSITHARWCNPCTVVAHTGVLIETILAMWGSRGVQQRSKRFTFQPSRNGIFRKGQFRQRRVQVKVLDNSVHMLSCCFLARIAHNQQTPCIVPESGFLSPPTVLPCTSTHSATNQDTDLHKSLQYRGFMCTKRKDSIDRCSARCIIDAWRSAPSFHP